MTRKVLGATAMLFAGSGLLAGAQIAAAEPSKEAKAFGARELVQDISLSTDGEKVAIIRPEGAHGLTLAIADLVTGATKPILASSGENDRLRSCTWTTATRLVCRIAIYSDLTGQRLGYTRMIAVDADGQNLKLLSQNQSATALGTTQNGGDVIDLTGAGTPGSVLMTRDYVKEFSTGTRLANTRSGLGVDQIDTVTLQRRPVEPPRDSASEYISDGAGHVRIMGLLSETGSGMIGDQMFYSYRTDKSREWQKLGTLSLDSAKPYGFDPYAVDAAKNVAYGFETQGGRQVLVSVALDGSLKKDVVVSRPDVDVEGLIQIGRSQRVVGATWTGDIDAFTFFDPELARLQTSLAKALPKLPLIRFADASADEGRLLLRAGSDDHPGIWYRYDKATKKLEELVWARPQLEGVALGKVTAVRYPAADGTMIPAYLTLPAGSNGKGLPAIVMPHGGPSSRDEWGFDWLAQFFAARGFAVLQPNYRGSTGYGEAWFAKNGFQSWRTAVGDIDDGGRWLLSQGIAAGPNKLAIVGWSYGGYAALQSVALDPTLFKAIVAIAPVTDLTMLRNESQRFTNYRLVSNFIGTGPHVTQGSPANHAAEVQAPVLLFHGDRDANVGVGESRLMADRLRGAGKQVEYVEYKGLDHQLDDSTVRAQMLDKADGFLRKALGM